MLLKRNLYYYERFGDEVSKLDLVHHPDIGILHAGHLGLQGYTYFYDSKLFTP